MPSLEGKDRFLKVYANLPEDIRKEIVAIVDGKPYTWNAALPEVGKETELGKKILEKLKNMELI